MLAYRRVRHFDEVFRGVACYKIPCEVESGRMLGGPMYTLERGLGWRKMGMLFAVFTAIAAFGIGCTVQANAISTIMHASYGISTEMSGGVRWNISRVRAGLTLTACSTSLPFLSAASPISLLCGTLPTA